jgi:hypothetical protein
MQADKQKKWKFIGCEIIYREACRLVAEASARIDVEFLPKALHDLETSEMVAQIQSRIDAVGAQEGYEHILLGYARCNDGVVGLEAREVPLVIPRAHDCITFFFGSRGAYRKEFDACPGTYYMTTGWCERNQGYEFGPGQPGAHGSKGIMESLGLTDSYEQMVAKYGKDNADFILEQLGDWTRHYSRMLYFTMGLGDERPFIEMSRERAAQRDWKFEVRPGDWSLLEKLFAGQWDEDFVVVPPGSRLEARNNEWILGPRGPEDQAPQDPEE